MLSDGNTVTVDAERFRRTSVVPALFHRYTSQRNPRHFFPKCDVDIRKESFANVVLSGGTDMTRKIVERMTKDQSGCCSAREKALSIDWRIDIVFPRHIRAGVNLEGRVRWILPDHRPQEVLLSSTFRHAALQSNSFVWRLIQSLESQSFDETSLRVCLLSY